jgi:hypothetical protein
MQCLPARRFFARWLALAAFAFAGGIALAQPQAWADDPPARVGAFTDIAPASDHRRSPRVMGRLRAASRHSVSPAGAHTNRYLVADSRDYNTGTPLFMRGTDAITAVRIDDFQRGRPVQRSRMRVSARDVAQAQPVVPPVSQRRAP